MLKLRVALLDADSRVLLTHDTGVDMWDLPGCDAGDMPLASLVKVLAETWAVTTFPTAFFPLTFALDETSGDTSLLYGCRNWVGVNGLQHIPARESVDMMWLRPARLGDYALTPACRMMAPVIMQLLG